MNFNLLSSLAQFKIGKLIAAEDFADKFHYQVSSAVILFMLALVSVKQYIFTPIQCWIPHEWHTSWEEFSENYCWVQDTYFSTDHRGPQRTLEERDKAKIGYYQWVPFVLLFQLLTFYLPHLFWQILSSQSGTDLNQMIRLASQADTIDPEKRKAMIKYLAREINSIVLNKAANRSPHQRQKTDSCFLRVFGFCLGRKNGMYLVVFYLIVKLMYITVDLLNLYAIREFFELGDDKRSSVSSSSSLMFGWRMFFGLLNGNRWEKSGHFPRVTWCDVPRVVVGSIREETRSIMCVLPLNMLNEKIFIFLWFWISIGIFLMVISILLWFFRLVVFRNRRQFLKNYLKIMNVIDEHDRRLAKDFTRKFMRYDGVFLLKMIALNSGDLVTAEVVREIWKLWKSNPNLHESDTPGNRYGSISGSSQELEEIREFGKDRIWKEPQEIRHRDTGIRMPPIPRRSSLQSESVLVKPLDNMHSVMRDRP